MVPREPEEQSSKAFREKINLTPKHEFLEESLKCLRSYEGPINAILVDEE